jgi:hypothetical protein
MYQPTNIYRHHSTDEPTKTVYANYFFTSIFKFEFDLDEVFDWYVKWDILHVKFKESDLDYMEIEPMLTAAETINCKRPWTIELDC